MLSAHLAKSISRPKLHMTARNGDLLLQLPYDLKDAFRAVFRTATWSGVDKAFVAKDTTANRNKWAKFVAEADSAVAALSAQEDVEASEAELKAMQDELAKLTAEAESLRAKAAAYRAKAAELKPQVAEAKEALVAAQADATEAKVELDAATAPAVAVYAASDMNGICSRLLSASRRGWAGKQALTDAQAELIAVRKKLTALGYEHKLLAEICDYSCNRPDRFSEAVPRLQTRLQIGLQIAEA